MGCFILYIDHKNIEEEYTRVAGDDATEDVYMLVLYHKSWDDEEIVIKQNIKDALVVVVLFDMRLWNSLTV